MRRLLRSFIFQARGLFLNRHKQAELDEEVQYHVDLIRNDYLQQGMEPVQARKAALKEFGHEEIIKEDCREAWGAHWLFGMIKEFRLGLRLLWKSKGFTAAVVFTLAICLAGNTIVFTILDFVLSAPPYPQPERVVQIYNSYPGSFGATNRLGGSNNAVSYFDYSENADAFEDLALIQQRDVNANYKDASERTSVLYVSKRFFDLVGLKPILGSYFTEEIYNNGDTLGASPVVLSESYWKNQMGGDRDVLEKIIFLNSRPKNIIGVAPHKVGTHFSKPKFYRPYFIIYREIEMRDDRRRHSNYAYLWGRLKEGVSKEQAKTQIDALDQRYFDRTNADMQEFIRRSQHETRMATFREITQSNQGNSLYLLQGSVLVVLLIGCLNVANLLVARGFGRRSEFAVRTALGASRLILVRQMLIECLVLVLGSCLAGYAFAWVALELVNQYLLTDLLSSSSVETVFLNRSALVFLIGVSLAVAVLLTLFSSISLVFSKRSFLGSIHNGSSKTTSNKTIRLIRSTLISFQVALTVILLIGAGLLIQSFLKAINSDPGFDPKNVYASKVGLPWVNFQKSEQTVSFRTRLKTSLLETPGIDSVAFTSSIPTVDELGRQSDIKLLGSSVDPNDELVSIRYCTVSRDYFELLGFPLLRGRFFNTNDFNREGLSLIIDKTFAEKYYKNLDPVGKYVGLSSSFDVSNIDPATTPVIVGVVDNVKHLGLDNGYADTSTEELPMCYFLFNKDYGSRDYSILIKSALPFEGLLKTVQEEVRKIEPRVPLFLNQPLETLVRSSLDDRRAFMLLVTILSGMALILSAIGIYGVLAFDVAQRTREIGLRMALGSTGKSILELLLRQGAIKVVVGLLLGLAGAFVLSSRISDFLYQVNPTEPIAFLLVALFVLMIAFLASYLPARKALHIDPMQALRVE
ncbi:MAG: ABC transporter permease [Verrucomicrobia bacterium]|nr:ABC transporter permease [Verrucomicrobiota bacterium]